MNDSDRYLLLHGPYHAPPFRYGDLVMDERRGEVQLVGLSGGRIPWPLGKRGSVVTLALFGDLARAVRCESAQAVAHWFGVAAQTVTVWRRVLGVGTTNEGTSRLRRDYALEPAGVVAREKAREKDQDPARRARIAQARRGKPRLAHVIEAMRKGRRGKPQSEEARQKMSLAHRQRGTRPPKAGRAWTAEEDELVRALPAAEVVQRTGRTLTAVYSRRLRLGLVDGRRKRLGS